MDLLGAILNSMDKPPTVNKKEKLLLKKQQEEATKRQDQLKLIMKKFKDETETKILNFINNPEQRRIKFPPMEQIYRAVVYEVAEEASGLIVHSFGKDGIDRYLMVYKREHPPSEDELATLRAGEEWTEDKARELLLKRQLAEKESIEDSGNKKRLKFTPNSNYREKYSHLIGMDAAKAAAKITKTNKQYGFVPSENKKDIRSIEQTLADIQNKKRKKLNEEKH